MMKPEFLSRMILAFLLAIVSLVLFFLRGNTKGVIDVHARMPEQGGWMPGEITAKVNQPLRLRLESDDVTHSFAVGQMEMLPVDLYPGEAQEVSLTFDKPGKYTYYCTRWCGLNHWRMRGTIEVTGDDSTHKDLPGDKPLYLELGIDIDAPHLAEFTPNSIPVLEDSQFLFDQLPEEYRTQNYYRTHSPSDALKDLMDDKRTQSLEAETLWSYVYAIWDENSTSEQIEVGRELYAVNCAACHGEQGAGNGVFAGVAEHADGEEMGNGSLDGHMLKTPTDFTDSASILGASPALLYGKIVRGGMGTGMPYWGPIFTDNQIWALISYIWTFHQNHN